MSDDMKAGDDAAVEALMEICADFREWRDVSASEECKREARAILTAIREGKVPGIGECDERWEGTVLAEIEKAYTVIGAPSGDPDDRNPAYIGDAVRKYVDSVIERESTASDQNSSDMCAIMKKWDQALIERDIAIVQRDAAIARAEALQARVAELERMVGQYRRDCDHALVQRDDAQDRIAHLVALLGEARGPVDYMAGSAIDDDTTIAANKLLDSIDAAIEGKVS